MLERFKFRAWDKNEKIMYDPRILDDSFINDEGFYKSDGFVQTSPYFRNLILMQYTGHKDKNGVEIYEGDIILGDWKDSSPMEVKWTDYAGCGCCDNSIGWEGIFRGIKCAIVGNIYQNPELIK